MTPASLTSVATLYAGFTPSAWSTGSTPSPICIEPHRRILDGIDFDGLIADKAFDSNSIIANLHERGAKIVISQHPRRAHWKGARDQTTLWSIANGGDEDAATVHSTQKPVECMRRPMINNSEAGDTIYEPFSGSGTTIIAAETTDRTCLAMEISPAYCDVAILRWQQFAGKPALLDGKGQTFNDIGAARKALVAQQ